MYKKVLLAYDGSVEGRRALREGAKLAQLCRAEVLLLAVVEVSSIMTPEAGLTIPIELQTEDYKTILNEGSERLRALGFSPTARLEVGDAGQKIAEVAEEMYISVNTVKTHLRNIYRKLAAAHRNEAVRRARELQLI